MSYNNLHVFKSKRVLLLQGPVGPFFRHFSKDLLKLGATVFKINFNAGDAFFFKSPHEFHGDLEEWPQWLEQFVKQHKIQVIILFGDCRPIHVKAHDVIQKLGLNTFVFEEGDLRPNHITLEHFGVNGHSQISKNTKDYLIHRKSALPTQQVIEVGKTFWYAAFWAIVYYATAIMGRKHFPKYEHHRPLTVTEAWPWVVSAWRKQYFRVKEFGVQKDLTTEHRREYFLVPLQLYNDAQITHHSDFNSIEVFITEVIESFAQFADKKHLLVIKQHPFDRGYKDYSKLIRNLGSQHQVSERIRYIHDQHLPTLLDNALGVVIINSTVGLSALDHGCAMKVCGNAIYDVQGLTYNGTLDTFWQNVKTFKFNHELAQRFTNYLTHHTQHNGSFYRRIKRIANSSSGVLWSDFR